MPEFLITGCHWSKVSWASPEGLSVVLNKENPTSDVLQNEVLSLVRCLLRDLSEHELILNIK